jgi:RNA chaperone Hfq
MAPTPLKAPLAQPKPQQQPAVKPGTPQPQQQPAQPKPEPATGAQVKPAAEAKQASESEPDALLWNYSRREKSPVAVMMLGGVEIRGIVQSFGKYSVRLQSDDGRVLTLFKTAMVTAELRRKQ